MWREKKTKPSHTNIYTSKNDAAALAEEKRMHINANTKNAKQGRTDDKYIVVNLYIYTLHNSMF